jgi:hypothetical protein
MATGAPTAPLLIAECLVEEAYYVFGLDASLSMTAEGWGIARKFTQDMAKTLLDLNVDRLADGKEPHQVAAYWFNGNHLDSPNMVTGFTDDYTTFSDAIPDNYDDVVEQHTNHPEGFQLAAELLDAVDSPFKSHVLITDGAPHTASEACEQGEKLLASDAETFLTIDAMNCRAECAEYNTCDATSCVAEGRPFIKADDCSNNNNNYKKATSCQCAVHVAERFNAREGFSTTVVGVKNYMNGQEYEKVFELMASTPDLFIDAMGGELGEDDITEYVDRTLRAACNTPYQKCQSLNDVSTFPRDEYTEGDDEFQHKSWAIGCDFAERSPDHLQSCFDECDDNEGCCGDTCSGNLAECDTSRLICRDACDYYYDLADG